MGRLYRQRPAECIDQCLADLVVRSASAVPGLVDKIRGEEQEDPLRTDPASCVLREFSNPPTPVASNRGVSRRRCPGFQRFSLPKDAGSYGPRNVEVRSR